MAEILIVDDERMIRAGLAQLLSGAGFSVREARDGKSALAAVAERRPDLVLLDIMMPGMDGFEVCEKILASDRDLPVVFLTAKDSESDQVRGLEVGADDFLSKTAGEEVLLLRGSVRLSPEWRDSRRVLRRVPAQRPKLIFIGFSPLRGASGSPIARSSIQSVVKAITAMRARFAPR